MDDPMKGLLIGAEMADEDEDDGGGDSKVDAAKDAIAAFKKGDAGALSLALERHYEACKASEYEPEIDEDEDEEL